MPKPFKKIVFPNGLRLLLVPEKASRASTVLTLVAAGAEYETKALNGISHFLEHLVFKGTKKRPRPEIISAELDALGAEYSAFTGEEYTGYWAKAENSKLEKLVELIADLYLNPLFGAEEIEKERGVVIEEINMYEDVPQRRAHELFTELLYGDQPAGWPITGKKETVRTIAREDIVRYRELHYVASKTLVIVAGSFSEAKITSLVKKLYGTLPKARAIAKPSTAVSQTKPSALASFKESAQSHLVLGGHAFDVRDKRRYALQVLSHVLGGGMSSRLFYQIREQLGAAYYISSHTEFLADHGYFCVSAGVDNAKIGEVIPAILAELRRAGQEIVPPAELQKAKDHMIGTFVMGLETSDELASFYGGQEIVAGTLVSADEAIARVRKVTAKEVQAIAKTLFVPKNLNLAVIGPHKDTAKLLPLLAL